ncbi:MAG: hypothetical protein U0641_01275 [Anaerolineae bacterium]
MPPKPAGKNRRTVATGAKLLIAAAALGGTLGAWATLSIAQDGTGDANATTAIVADAPPDPWADFAAALPPVPTLTALQRRPLVFATVTPLQIPEAPQLDRAPVESPKVAAAPVKPAAPVLVAARPAPPPAAPPPAPEPTLRAVDAPPPPQVVADVPAAQAPAAVSGAGKKSAGASAPAAPQPAPKPVTRTKSSR